MQGLGNAAPQSLQWGGEGMLRSLPQQARWPLLACLP